MGVTALFIFCLLGGVAYFWPFWKCVDWFETIQGEKRIKFMYTTLFVISITLFGYLAYVLIRPEKF